MYHQKGIYIIILCSHFSIIITTARVLVDGRVKNQYGYAVTSLRPAQTFHQHSIRVRKIISPLIVFRRE